LKNVASLVSAGGSLFIAIYNDQGRASRLWKVVKNLYNRSFACRLVITPVFLALMVAHGLVLDLIEWKNPFSRYRDYKERRGMSAIPDVFDWLGGYPFEFARPDQVFRFYRELGFSLVNLTSCGGGRGNNQYVFMKDPSSEPRLRERARQHSGKRARIQQAYSDLTALEFPN
jgi:hypothetical protein